MSVEAGTILRVVAELIAPQSSVMQNVFYTKFDDTGGSNENQDVVDDCVDWVDALYLTLVDEINASVIPGEVKVYLWDTIGLDWDELGSGSMGTSFTNADQMLPHGVAAIVSARTFNPDVTGRKFFGGFAEDQQSQSILDAAAVIALAFTASAWIEPFTGLATGSVFKPGVWSVVDVAFRQFVETVIINALMGYQRRRKPGVGI